MTGVAAIIGIVPTLNVTATLGPSSQTSSGTTGGFSFSSTTVGVTGGSPTSYNWRFPSTDGTYPWSIISGQGTSSAVARVTTVATGDTAFASMVCDVVVSGMTFTSSGETLQYTRTGP